MFMRRLVVVFVLTFLGTFSLAQDFSNKGKEFWVGYGSHVAMYNGINGTVDVGGGAQDMVLYFTSDRNANVTVSIPSLGWTNTYTVVANAVTTSAPENSISIVQAMMVAPYNKTNASME